MKRSNAKRSVPQPPAPPAAPEPIVLKVMVADVVYKHRVVETPLGLPWLQSRPHQARRHGRSRIFLRGTPHVDRGQK
jgi:hypothetical protein